MARTDQTRRALLRSVAGLLFLMMQGCYGGKTSRIEYVIPDGFHGVFIIKEDRNNGSPPEQTDDGFRYTIPDSGVLITSDISPFHDWHTSSAAYVSGVKIPVGMSKEGSRYALISLTGIDYKGQIMKLIGTAEEARQYSRNRRVWFEIERADQN